MRSLLLAISFIRVPRLFFSLLFWPLIIGLGVALAQMTLSLTYLNVVTQTPETMERQIARDRFDERFIRQYLYNTDTPLGAPAICRWAETREGTTLAATPGCPFEDLDVIIRVENPETFDVSPYEEMFLGATKRIHICSNCDGNIVIEEEDERMVANLYHPVALGVYMLKDVTTTRMLSKHLVHILEKRDTNRGFEGAVFFNPSGHGERINLTTAGKTMILVVNTSGIVIIALWLALRAHRKVLDYFSRNNALLPLVAACGSQTFYLSLWFITVFRVGFFLLASVPLTILLYSRSLSDESLASFTENVPELSHWIIAIVTGLAAISLIASIGELKQRAVWHSFLYKYLPLIICMAGTAIWFTTLFVAGDTSLVIQNFTAAIPIFGISPLLLSPVIKLHSDVITAHALLSTVLIVIALKTNSRWFAAHLEEI